MKKTITIFSLLFAAVMTVSAREVTSDEALSRIVAEWGSGSAHRAPAGRNAFTLVKTGTDALQKPAYYIFNRANGGYVIAPAVDDQPALLAVIDEGCYDEGCLPPAFSQWLDEITRYGAAVAPAKVGKAADADPLLNADMIAWGQEGIYNRQCPKINFQGYPYTPPAGCAAIAIGQIMRYHKWPLKGNGNVSYTNEYFINTTFGTVYTDIDVDLSAHTYDWSKILGNYKYLSSTSDQQNEAAKFVADVAVASYMQFGITSSATTDNRVATALKTYFDYDRSLQLLDHAYYTVEEWADIIRHEIDEGRPVYLSGCNVTASNSVVGHAFVVDGYKSDGTFHINWGWDGTSNGDYHLTSLCPGVQGTGGSAGGYAFMQNAIVGIRPNEGGAEAPAFLALDEDYYEVTYDAENDGYIVRFFLKNPTANDFQGFYALRMTENGRDLFSPKDHAHRVTCRSGYGFNWATGIDRQSLTEHPNARIELVYAYVDGADAAKGDQEKIQALINQIDDETGWTTIKARSGAPNNLTVYAKGNADVDIKPTPDDAFQLRLASLKANGSATAGNTCTFTATVRNMSDYEYFAPLYLFVYNSAETQFLAWSDYNLHYIPAHGEATVDFVITLPSSGSNFRYAVANEPVGYFWTYDPMKLCDREAYSTTPGYTSQSPVTYDANADGVIDGDDVEQVAKYILQRPSYMLITPADINANGAVTISDLTRIIQRVTK